MRHLELGELSRRLDIHRFPSLDSKQYMNWNGPAQSHCITNGLCEVGLMVSSVLVAPGHR